MKNRLEVARELLRDDGSIWINIDDDKAHYLKVLCDDIFGRENFLANVIWEKSDSPRMDASFFSVRHDHVIVFSKNKAHYSLNKIWDEEIPKHYNKIDKDGKKYYLKPLMVMGGNESKKLFFPLIAPDGTKVFPKKKDGSDGCWRWSKEKIERENNRIEWIDGNDGWVPYFRIYAENRRATPPETLWNFSEAGSNRNSQIEIKNLFHSRAFSTPKPEKLIHKILHIGSNEGDVVLDFFAGSATTAAVAHKMNRQWITVEQMDYVETITVERLKKVIGKKVQPEDPTEEIEYDTGGISKSVNWQGGGDFIYFELMQYNEAYMDKTQAAQSSEELVELWKDIAENSFLNWYINSKIPEDAINDFIAKGNEENGFDKQKKLIAKLLNKNQLYINLSEIDDENFGINEEDKILNREFYGDWI